MRDGNGGFSAQQHRIYRGGLLQRALDNATCIQHLTRGAGAFAILSAKQRHMGVVTGRADDRMVNVRASGR